jgi:hypothetical protein
MNLVSLVEYELRKYTKFVKLLYRKVSSSSYEN